jgi:serine/threonine protein phosphatase PrpC
MHCYALVAHRGRENPSARTTVASLTLWISVWPRAYLLHVGRSRCYLLREGALALKTPASKVTMPAAGRSAEVRRGSTLSCHPSPTYVVE